MTQTPANMFEVKFPGDLDYIPAIRKFVSEVLIAHNFTPKFAYRSEVIIDELCNNAVQYGCLKVDALIELVCTITGDHIEFLVKDQGGRHDDIEKLNTAVKSPAKIAALDNAAIIEAGSKGSLGLELVRMLSDELALTVDSNNITSVRVVKQREEEPAAPQQTK